MTAEEYIDAVRMLPCCICGVKPVSGHHVVGGSIMIRLGDRGVRKHSDFLTIPLCHAHHQGAEGLHAIGVLTWEARYGSQEYFVTMTGKRMGIDPWAEAANERQAPGRPYKRLSKVMVRRWQ